MTNAIWNRESLATVDARTIEDIARQAAASANGRFRLCLHESVDAVIQEMLIAATRDAYFRPHRHPPGKSETCIVLEGELDMFVFDENGRVTQRVELAPTLTGKTFLFRAASPVWHLPVARTERTVYYEVFQGPFCKDVDTEYAPWSPREEDAQAVRRFLDELRAA